MTDRFDFAAHITQFDREYAALRAGIVPTHAADAIAGEAAALERDRATAADAERRRLALEQSRIPIVRAERERARADAERSARRCREIRELGWADRDRARALELDKRR